jgi:hypothetical protein
LYETYDTKAGEPLVNIGVEDVTQNLKSFPLKDDTWKKNGVDLNDGVAKGDRIYFYQRRANGA